MIRNNTNLRENINFAPLMSANIRNVELVSDIISEIVDYVIRISPALKGIARMLREGKTSEANLDFTTILEGIDWIAQLISVSKDRYGRDFTLLKCSNLTVQELEEELLNILTELIPAQIRKDWGLMADLVEFELYRNINSWGTVFPQLLELEEKI
jgi:hypothetical protein